MASAKLPLMLKLVREKDSWEKKNGDWFHRVFVCVIGHTLGFLCFLFYSWMSNQWTMNHCIYAQRLVHYRIFVWIWQHILWSLLRLLRLIINDHKKCVTSSLGKWRSSRSDDHKFLTHQYTLHIPPSFINTFQWFCTSSKEPAKDEN